MKKLAISEELSADMKVQAETIKAYNNMLGNLEINNKVLGANIHELFIFYD
jgi:hypothetical protein